MFCCSVGKFTVPLQVGRHDYLLACCWRHEPIQTHVAIFPSSHVCRSFWRLRWPNLDSVISPAGHCSSIVNTSTVTKAACDLWLQDWLIHNLIAVSLPLGSDAVSLGVWWPRFRHCVELSSSRVWNFVKYDVASQPRRMETSLYRSETLKPQTLNIRISLCFLTA